MSDIERPDGPSHLPDAPEPEPKGPDPAEETSAAGPEDPIVIPEEPISIPRLTGRRKGRRLLKKDRPTPATLTPEQRLLLLDTWGRSGLPAKDFAALTGVSAHTLYSWKKRFEEQGPAGLLNRARGGPRGSRLPELTKRAILMLKEANPEDGCQRISDMLARGPALPASPSAVARVLHEAGYELEEVKTHPHRDKVRRFERAKANQLWQSDIFTFMLKRQNRRVHLIAFLDDHSRFVVSFGLHASASTALVLEVLRAGIASFGAPEEILTDQGPQYHTWRGKSAFDRECEKLGVKHLLAAPQHPMTVGKTERFWGTLWRECVEKAVFLDMEDARKRIGLFVDHYNFRRTHQGIDGLVPADRFFGAAPEVLSTLKKRVTENALSLAKNGVPKEPFYLTGQVAGRPFSVHADGERVILTDKDGRKEVDLVPPANKEREKLPDSISPQGRVPSEHPEQGSEEPAPPGTSPIDDLFKDDEGGQS